MFFCLFFFNDTATTEIYTLSLHDALPICHIELASPVSHVWFFKGLPSRIGHLLDISLRDLERILYFESYVVIDPIDTELKEKELLSEERFRELRDQYGDGGFVAKMGAEAIKELLRRIEVDDLS